MHQERAYAESSPAETVTVPPRLGARFAPGCRPRGCRAPARRVLGRRVRYVIGAEPGQIPGRRWPSRKRCAVRPVR
ncbi:tryptophan biosynthesis modulator TrpM [Phaeacidiphilus oryzae]|uniref:tryptophan biosynthesis modulator TrpM n=1 Tax=Phaeacidiphilus oryzae TaxID=348818 RepID=UPI000A0253C7